SPRRAAFFAVLALALFASLRPLGPKAAPVAAPEGGSAAALFLGPFRAIVADALWVRLLDRYEAGAYEEVLPLAQALLALDPRFEQAWTYAAWTLAVNLPALEQEPARWPWVREGFLLAREGARRNPGSWALL